MTTQFHQPGQPTRPVNEKPAVFDTRLDNQGKSRRLGSEPPTDIIAFTAEDAGVYYHANMHEHEGSEFLWWDKARKFAWRWLENQDCKNKTNRHQIVSKAEKENLVRSRAGFDAFLESVDDGWFDMQQETMKHRWKQSARTMLYEHFKFKLAESDAITRSAMGSAESEAEYLAACITGAEGRVHGTQAHLSASDDDLYDYLCTAVHLCIDAGVSYGNLPRTINQALKLASILHYKGTWADAIIALKSHLVAIATQREEPPVTPKEETAMKQLNETLETAQAEQDKPAKSHAEWTDDQSQLGVYFQTLDNLCNSRNLTPEQKDDVRREAQGCEHIHETEYDKNTLTKRTKDIIDRLYPAHVPEVKTTEKAENAKTAPKAAQNTSDGVQDVNIENGANSMGKVGLEIDSSKPTEITIEKLSPDEPRPIEMVTTIDSSTGEIIVFDPNRAINLTKARSALVNRLVQDKVLVKGVDYGEVPGTDKATLLKPGAEKLLSAFQLYDKFTDIAVERNWKDGFFFYEYECTLYDRESGKAIGSGIGSCNSMEKKYRFRWVTKDRVPKSLNLEDLPARGGKISEFDFAVDKAETSGKYGKPAEYWQQFKSALANGTAVTIDRKDSKGNNRKAIEIDTTMYGIPNEDIFDLVNTISKMAQKRALVAAALNATGASAVFTQDQEDFTDFGLIEAA